MPPKNNSTPYDQKVNLYQAMADLEAPQEIVKKTTSFNKAFLLSFLLPPIGVYYFIKYIFFSSSEEYNLRVGLISLGLTIISFIYAFT